MIKQQIEQDLKAALLSHDSKRATTLRGLKSAILYAEIAHGKRENGLTDEEITALLAKEAKKRQESAELYLRGDRKEQAEAELAEKALIETYLPRQMSDDELEGVIDEAIRTTGVQSIQMMGQVIGVVKQKVGSSADGSRIAQKVKERLA